MQWCVAGLVASVLALAAGIAYRSLPMLAYAVAMGAFSGTMAWLGHRRGWFEPW